ncbi:S-adenosylmethionine mitochondrial carrier protein isoform X5 [Tupaia chinensis]|uniref:S-adenosylmethionine mitochondrial carrier protein isoform X5 n=1 Tax=Tupaia chinensis TaxID=246437 RepID=UPI0003C908BD|nr:S-adenosylmethionine mitochondrial carrier protein isoform X5 [Tupaia chinensis]
MDRPGFAASLVAGGIAGVSVDLILFPLDTIKTRLQSPQGFIKAGGFHGIYAGVPSAAIGSFPNAAAFFITYEYVKWFLHTGSSSYMTPVKHMLAASAGEVVACLIRVPSEVVKQRAQVSASSRTFQIFSNILGEEGIQGLYRGYKSTVLREIPFSLVQFPLWESLKESKDEQHARPWAEHYTIVNSVGDTTPREMDLVSLTLRQEAGAQGRCLSSGNPSSLLTAAPCQCVTV